MRVSDFKPIEDLFPPVAADLSPDKALVPSGTGCKVDPISSFYNQVKEPHDVDVTDVIRNTCPHNLIQQSCDRMQCKDRWKCCPAFNNLEPVGIGVQACSYIPWLMMARLAPLKVYFTTI